MSDPQPYIPDAIGQLPTSGDPRVDTNYYLRVIKGCLENGTFSAPFTQTGHGFTLNVPFPARFNGTAWVKSQADNATNAIIDAIVTPTDANTLLLQPFVGSTITGTGWTAGTSYYLSAATAGLFTSTAPSGVGNVVIRVLKALTTTTADYVGNNGTVISSSTTVSHIDASDTGSQTISTASETALTFDTNAVVQGANISHSTSVNTDQFTVNATGIYLFGAEAQCGDIAGSDSNLIYVDGSVPGGNTIANTATETPFASTYTFGANTLTVGQTIRILLAGVYGTDVVPPTINVKIKLGSTVMIASGVLTAVGSLTNRGWTAFADLVVTAIGASGSIEAQGFGEYGTAATTSLTVNMSNIAPITIDTTTSQALTVTITWGTSSANNTITLRIIEVYSAAALAVGSTARMYLKVGATFVNAQSGNLNALDSTYLSVGRTMKLSTSDVVTATLYQTSGADLNVVTKKFWITQVG